MTDQTHKATDIQPQARQTGQHVQFVEPEVGEITNLDSVKEKSIAETYLEKKTEHEIKEIEEEKKHDRFIQKIRAVWGLLIVSIMTFIVLAGLSIVFWKLISVVFDPSIPKEDKQLAVSLASLILGGAITFLLTKVIPFFEKKD